MKKLINAVQEVSWHRNGIGGRGFYAVLFTADVDGVSKEEAERWNIPLTDGLPNARWYAVLTDDPGECYVTCLDLIPTKGVRFAGGNSWRGDNYEPELREAIESMQSSGSTRLGPFGVPT